jgi:hypothetical protein
MGGRVGIGGPPVGGGKSVGIGGIRNELSGVAEGGGRVADAGISVVALIGTWSAESQAQPPSVAASDAVAMSALKLCPLLFAAGAGRFN